MKKIRLLFLLVGVFSLTSCATIFSRKTYSAKFYSKTPGAKAKIDDRIYTLPAKLKLPRSRKDMQVTLITDTLTKDFTVKAGMSPKFVFGNLLFVQLCKVAYAVDFTNQKRFYYGKSINLDANDTITVLRPMPGRFFKRYADKRYPVEKGQIFLELSAPYMNGFYMQPRNEPAQGYFGFFGFSAGVSYYYKNHKYLKLGASAATDFLVPVPLPITRDGPYESVGTYF